MTNRPEQANDSSVAQGEEYQTERRYRVLMIAPTSFFADYGCHVRIFEETHILQRLGHLVTIACYHNGKDVPGLDIRRTLPIPWRRDYEVGSSRHKLAFDVLLGLRILQLLLFNRFVFNRYDLIHAHLHEGALMGLFFGWLFRIPTVFDFQGSMTEEMLDHNFLRRDSWLFKPLRRLEEWIDRRASAIFTSSANAERLLIQEFGCNAERIHILQDCVNADTFKARDQYDPAELVTLRQNLGIPSAAKVILYAGLLAPYQGIDLLLEAFQRIHQHDPSVYLLVMGYPNVQLYEHQARTLGIDEVVVFTGQVSYQSLPELLALGDVAVAPKLSLTEGCGKLLNYMAAALPTVAFDTPVAREYLGLDGILATRGDVDSLAEKLQQALSMVSHATAANQGIGARLRQRAIQHFEWQKAGKKIVEIYSSLLGETTSKSTAQNWAVPRESH